MVVPEGGDEDGEGDEDAEGVEVEVQPPTATPYLTPSRVAAKGPRERLSGLPHGRRCPLVCPSPGTRLWARPTNFF